MIPSLRRASQARTAGGWAILVAAATLMAFATARGGALLAWDDDINIVGNTHLRALNWDNVRWMFVDFDYMRRYVPLTWLGWGLEDALFGLTAQSCHVGNLLLHAANAVLLFLVTREVLRLWLRESVLSDRTQIAACAAGALFWAVHPLRVEVVAWASGRIYAQAMFFLLFSTLCYFHAARAEPGTARRRAWFGATIAAYTMSLLTYPLGFTYVVVLLVADIWLLRRLEPAASRWWRAPNRGVWLEKIPLIIVAAVMVGLTLAARFHAKGLWEPPPTLAQFGVAPRIMQACFIWAHYLWRPLVPFGLAPVYTTLVWFKPTDFAFVASALGLLIITVVAWRRRGEWPGAFALWTAHLVLLVPTLGLTEYPHYPNDRYSYLQGMLWAPAVAVALLWLRRRSAAPLAGVLAATVLVGMSVLTVGQIRIWRNSEAGVRYLYAHVGDSRYRADTAFRLAEVLRAQNRLAESANFYRETLRIESGGRRASAAHFGLGLIARTAGRQDEARGHYEAAIRLRPDFAPAYAGLGEILALGGQREAAISSFNRALRLDPEDKVARAALEQLQAH